MDLSVVALSLNTVKVYPTHDQIIDEAIARALGVNFFACVSKSADNTCMLQQIGLFIGTGGFSIHQKSDSRLSWYCDYKGGSNPVIVVEARKRVSNIGYLEWHKSGRGLDDFPKYQTVYSYVFKGSGLCDVVRSISL